MSIAGLASRDLQFERPGGQLAPRKILVVDDEIDLVETYVRLLEYLGYSCDKACTPPQALDRIEAEQPALILTDLRLNPGDGFEILRHVRAKWPETPVIVMTAYHNDETAKAAREAGARAYLRKPFSNAELARTIRTALGTSTES
jgi:CheY-like chemotaxis protein